jgi:hypothetical protein
MTRTITKSAAFALVLFTMTLAPSAKADEWDKKTLVTTNHSIQIQGKILESGQYVMKLLDSPSDRRILQVYNADETKLEMTILAGSAYRLEPTGDTRLTFSEMEDGQPPALRTWFYPGDNSGLEFPPTH